jgi:hypothetical protein
MEYNSAVDTAEELLQCIQNGCTLAHNKVDANYEKVSMHL